MPNQENYREVDTKFGQVTIDSKVHAAYVSLQPNADRAPHTFIVDNERHVDYTVNGKPMGVEVLAIDRGVKAKGLPSQAVDALEIAGVKIIESPVGHVTRRWKLAGREITALARKIFSR